MVNLIENYLDELAGRIAGNGADVRGFLLEVESHLSDARAAAVARGLSAQAADEEAIRSFGTPRQVADAARRDGWRASIGAVARDAAHLFLQLGVVGLLVVGASGVAAQFIARFGLTDAIYGLPSTVSIPVASCARWLSLHPDAGSCRAAATAEASRDMTMALIGAGILGLLGAALLLVIRAVRRGRPRNALPRTLGPTIATTMFAAASMGLAALAASNAVVFTAWGQGLWWTQSACALLAALVSLVMLVRAMSLSYSTPPVRPAPSSR
jgi:hypothetical protein